MDDKMKRAVIHYDKDGFESYFADDGVTLLIVDDRVPSDRIYRTSPTAIPDDLLDGEVGHKDDNSWASVRLIRAMRDLDGLPAFDVIEASKDGDVSTGDIHD